jgi:hypothetical protein
MTLPTSHLAYCHHPDKEARLTWVMSLGQQDSGPCCGACLAALWAGLSRYPNAIETATLWPIGVDA